MTSQQPAQKEAVTPAHGQQTERTVISFAVAADAAQRPVRSDENEGEERQRGGGEVGTTEEASGGSGGALDPVSGGEGRDAVLLVPGDVG